MTRRVCPPTLSCPGQLSLTLTPTLAPTLTATLAQTLTLTLTLSLALAPTPTLVRRVLDAAAEAGVGVSWHLEPYGGRTAQTVLADLRYPTLSLRLGLTTEPTPSQVLADLRYPTLSLRLGLTTDPTPNQVLADLRYLHERHGAMSRALPAHLKPGAAPWDRPAHEELDTHHKNA